MKKLLGLFAVAVLASTANAEVSPKCGVKRFTGWNVGANLQTSATLVKVPDNEFDAHSGRTGFGGGLFAGYSVGFGKVGFAAVEGSFSLSSTKFGGTSDFAGASHTSTSKRPYSVGMSFLGGVAPSQNSSSVIYAGLTFEYANWKINESFTANGVKNSLVNVKKNVFGVGPVLGYRTFLGENSKVFVDGRYEFIKGGKLKSKGETLIRSTTNHVFKIGVGYKF